MKLFKRALAVLLPSFLALFAEAAQIPTGAFSHIIIVVQENRTPDNLFGVYATGPNQCTGSGYTIPGADLFNGPTNGSNGTYTCNQTFAMNSGFFPGHVNAVWKDQYDNGKMDMFCDFQHNGYVPPCPTYSNV
jgi:phospholipase C